MIGGGSGHEPLFHGFIGDNMADGAPCGNIFAAPTPDLVLAVTEALNQGNGVLYLYNNYTGDVLNFDMAAELAAEEGIRVVTVLIHDDIASAPPEQKHLRRGIAGDVLIIKIAGGMRRYHQDLRRDRPGDDESGRKTRARWGRRDGRVAAGNRRTDLHSGRR